MMIASDADDEVIAAAKRGEYPFFFMAGIRIEGYPRDNKRFGVRNHVVVMAGVACANSIVERIARELPLEPR